VASDLLTIARSGAQAARTALDLTAQNIANAATEGYVRRSVRLAELAGARVTGGSGDPSLSGVRVAGIVRNADQFREAEVRRTGSDSARADAQVAAYGSVESAIEQANVYPAITGFEAGLKQLATDPVNGALRGVALAGADTMAQNFAIAWQGLAGVGTDLAQHASDGALQVNTLAADLAQLNLKLARTAASSADQSGLLDRRDQLLQKLGGLADVTTTFAPDQSVTVQLGGVSGPALVSGATTTPFAVTTAFDGTISFDVGGTPVGLAGGSLAGVQQGLVKLRDTRNALDVVAATLIGTANTAQASGVDVAGAGGQPLFSGTGASSIAAALPSGAQLATAPAGAGSGSRNSANIDALNQALASADPAGAMDTLLSDVANAVASTTVTRDTLKTIASSAQASLQQQAGVDLDHEAVDLVHFQQAFQASGRVMQVASDLFSTLLGIR